MLIPIMCADPHMATSTTCANVPILSIPNFNVYQQSVLEIDTRFGEYNLCNPDEQTGRFVCLTPGEVEGDSVAGCPGVRVVKGHCFPGQPVQTSTATVEECCALAKQKGFIDQIWNHYPNNTCTILDARTMGQNNQPIPCDGMLGYMPSQNQSQTNCWYDNPQWVTDFGDECSRQNCTCEVISKKAVGREFLAETMGGGGSFSPKCMAAIDDKCGIFKNKNETHACEVCVEVAAQKLMHEHTCTPQALGMAIMMICQPPVPGGGGGSSLPASQMLIVDKVMPLAQRLNGTWYSTEAEGQCVGESRPGDGSGCFWRLLENSRVVNASCVNSARCH